MELLLTIPQLREAREKRVRDDVVVSVPEMKIKKLEWHLDWLALVLVALITWSATQHEVAAVIDECRTETGYEVTR